MYTCIYIYIYIHIYAVYLYVCVYDSVMDCLGLSEYVNIECDMSISSVVIVICKKES